MALTIYKNLYFKGNLIIFSKKDCTYCEKMVKLCEDNDITYMKVNMTKETFEDHHSRNNYICLSEGGKSILDAVLKKSLEDKKLTYDKAVSRLKQITEGHKTFPWIFEATTGDFLGGYTDFKKQFENLALTKYGMEPDF